MATSGGAMVYGFQPLIDCRLELIDRLLYGVVPRAERFEIVRRTQERIEDLLGELGTTEPSREQVLAVLSRLDPPEALLPNPADLGGVFSAGPGVSGLWGNFPSLPRPTIKSAKVACGLGAASLALLLSAPFFYVAIAMFGSALPSSEIVLLTVLGVYLALLLGMSIAACTTSFVAMWKLRRRRGTHGGHLWATAGLVAALFPLGMASLATLYLGMNLHEFL